MANRVPPPHPRSRGFTLIELLVVVVVVGILALALTLSVVGSAERRVEQQAERFRALVGQACEQAELGGREIGVVVAASGYSFRRLAGTDWQAEPPDGELRARQWMDGLRVALAREGRAVDLSKSGDKTPPQLVCFSSGELTPFVLTLSLGDVAPYRVHGADDASLAIDRAGAPR